MSLFRNKGRPWPQAQLDRLTILRAQGMTFGQIADNLGVSRDAVSGMIGRRARAERSGEPQPRKVWQHQPGQRALVCLSAIGIKPDANGILIVPDAILTAELENTLDEVCSLRGLDWKTVREAA